MDKKKPAPDIYLKAASLLGIAPSACLVVEDAINGVQSGKAAGAHVLALTTSFSRKELVGADFFAATLADAPPAALDW